jgi:hypothetical protein
VVASTHTRVIDQPIVRGSATPRRRRNGVVQAAAASLDRPIAHPAAEVPDLAIGDEPRPNFFASRSIDRSVAG